MPIEQVQRLLGHIKIEATMQYVMVKQSNVKFSHRKYIGQRGFQTRISAKSFFVQEIRT